MEIVMPLRIIVVDDRTVVRESLSTVLTLEDDFEVVGEAGDARQAIYITEALKPDLVLMDCEMPGTMDGIDACQEIKERHLARIVIILTMHGDPKARERARKAGCDLFLEKSITTTELIGQVRRLARS